MKGWELIAVIAVLMVCAGAMNRCTGNHGSYDGGDCGSGPMKYAC